MSSLKVVLITGRTIDQGTAKEYGKFSQEYFESVAVCEIDPMDMKRLGIKENMNVQIDTDHGSVVMRGKESTRGPHPQIIFIPYGPWVNVVVNPRTHGTGMPSLKGFPAEIKPATEEKVLSLPELLNEHYGKG